MFPFFPVMVPYLVKCKTTSLNYQQITTIVIAIWLANSKYSVEHSNITTKRLSVFTVMLSVFAHFGRIILVYVFIKIWIKYKQYDSWILNIIT